MNFGGGRARCERLSTWTIFAAASMMELHIDG
jgi:hypothetical protein